MWLGTSALQDSGQCHPTECSHCDVDRSYQYWVFDGIQRAFITYYSVSLRLVHATNRDHDSAAVKE